MKNIYGLFLAAFSAVLLFCTTGCGEQPASVNGKQRITAGLPPVAHIARCIAGDRFEIQTMLPEGKSPHDYAPGPQDVRNASGSKIFFSTGLPFEVRAVKPLRSVKIADVTVNTHKIPFGGDHEHGPGCIHDHNDHTGHHHEAMDPHVWLDLGNVEAIAKNITAELAAADPDGRAVYEKRAAFCNLYVNEAESLRDSLALRFNKKGVEIGILGIPEGGGGYPCGVFASKRGNLSAFAIKDGHLRCEVYIDLHASVVFRVYEEIAHVSLGTREKVHVAENTVMTEEILILKVGTVAPLENGDAYFVFAFLHKVGDVKLRLKMRAL